MFFSGRDWKTSQDRGKDERSKVQSTCSRVLRTSDWFTFQQDNKPKHTARTTQEFLNVLELPSQNLYFNTIEHLWRDLKIAVQWRSPSNLTELERICREEWEKLPKYRCAKLVPSNPRRLEDVIAVKGASTKSWVKGLNNYANVVFLVKMCYKSKNLFLLCRYGVLCVDWWGKKIFNTF